MTVVRNERPRNTVVWYSRPSSVSLLREEINRNSNGTAPEVPQNGVQVCPQARKIKSKEIGRHQCLASDVPENGPQYEDIPDNCSYLRVKIILLTETFRSHAISKAQDQAVELAGENSEADQQKSSVEVQIGRFDGGRMG